MNPKQFSSQEEYKNFVQHCLFLVDSELKKLEDMKEKEDHQHIAIYLPKNISAVNFLGYLRGQDGMFVDARPHVDFQQDLYAMENQSEKRLFTLIEYVKTTESKDLLKSQIIEYYVKARGFRD